MALRKSCLPQLLAHIDTVMEWASNDANANVLHLDFAKAFDKVDRHMLISKLENIRIKGKVELVWQGYQITLVEHGRKALF